MKENKKENSKLNPKMIIAGIAAVVVIAMGVVLGIQFFGEMTTPQKTIEGYLTSLYCNTMIREMQEYLVDDIKDLCYDEYTVFGQTVAYMQDLQHGKAPGVGLPYTISVNVDEETSASATAVKNARTTYGANQLRDVEFTATFSGPDGSRDFGGVARVAQIDGKWYLTEYNIALAER